MLSKDRYFLPLKRFICDENRKKSCQRLSADDNKKQLCFTTYNLLKNLLFKGV
jgi:hypothetical protein